MDPLAMRLSAEAWSYRVPLPLQDGDLETLVERIISLGAYDGRACLDEAGDSCFGQVLAELTRRSFALRHEDPTRSLQIIDLAQMLVWQIPKRAQKNPELQEVVLAVRGFQANALRVAGHLRSAGEVWAEIGELLTPQTENVILHGVLLEFRASFSRAQRHFRETRAFLAQAAAIYRGINADHFLGAVKVIQSSDSFFQGDTELALEQLVEGLRYLEPSRGLGQSLFALHNAVVYLLELGYLRQAVFVFEQIECLYPKGGSLTVVRAGWLKGRIALKGGNTSGAIELLDRARRELVERDLSYDAALAGLDLALAYTEAKDSVAVMRLAEEMYPVFVAHDIPREASAALLQFYRSAEDLRVSSRMINETIAYLAELRRRPSGAVPE